MIPLICRVLFFQGDKKINCFGNMNEEKKIACDGEWGGPRALILGPPCKPGVGGSYMGIGFIFSATVSPSF